jgi:hypothetical protein
MNKLLSTILTMLMLSGAYAQEDVKSIIDRVNAADYIFEGKVISSKPYKTADKKKIYTSNAIQITKIFKGNLTCGTVEVITNGGQVDDLISKHSEFLELKEGYTGIFLCGLNEKELSAVAYVPITNVPKLTTIFEKQSYIKYYTEGLKILASDVTFNFDSLAKVYDLTEYVTQVNYVDCNNTETVLGTSDTFIHVHPAPDNFHFPVYSRAKYDSVMSRLNWKVANIPHQTNVLRSTKTLTYTISNAIITGSATKYFEFDVNLADDNGTVYFNSGLIKLQYSSSAFGSNVVSANTIQVTRGALISDTSTYAFPTPADISANVVAIPLSINVPLSVNLAPMPATPTQAVHVKMQIQTCNSGGNIQFTDQATMLLLSYYGVNANDTFGTPYDNIVATQVVNVPACAPTITSYTPSSIDAGVNEILEIHGFQFGDNQGNGNVFFPNANDGGMSKAGMNYTDFFYWSDTLIKIVFPSFCDTVQTAGGSIITQPDQVPGTGNFYVITDAGDMDSTTSPLTVRYGVASYPIPNKVPFNLIAADTNGGYDFYMDTALWNNTAARACVYKAVADWHCLTGVNWHILGSIVPPSDSAEYDSVNIIQLGYTGYSPLGTVLANTSTWGKVCGNKAYYPELDIVANATLNWWYDTTSTAPVPAGMRDFYAMILHELGHAHVLTHVINPSGVMDFASEPTGPLPAASRKIVIEYDAACAFGGNEVMTASSGLTYSCTTAPLHIVPQYLCSPFTAITDVASDVLSLNVYPNPFINNVTVQYTLTKESTLDMYVMDMQGNIVASGEKRKYGAGEYKVELPLNGLATGQYLLWGHVDGAGYFKTITCVH